MSKNNNVDITGNLTRDVEVRYTPKGTAVADISIAINRKYKVDDETREETTYVDVTYWGRDAENVAKYFKKGDAIRAIGRLSLDQWEDKATGQQRSRLKVVGEDWGPASWHSSANKGRSDSAQSSTTREYQDDGIPF